MKAPNLILHCGGETIERNMLSSLPVPEATQSYVPVAHHELLDITQDALKEFGFSFGVEAHGIAKEGSRYFGIVHLLHESMNEQHALVMGIRNSTDKSIAASLAFGSCVFVCDNLAFTGEVTISRKHTTHIMAQLPGLIRAGVSNTRKLSQVQDQRFERYQYVNISDSVAHDLIIQMLRVDAITTTRVSKIVQEWHEPSHDEFTERGTSVWRLFNAVTEGLKGTPLHDMPRRTIEVQAVLDRHTNFKPNLNF